MTFLSIKHYLLVVIRYNDDVVPLFTVVRQCRPYALVSTLPEIGQSPCQDTGKEHRPSLIMLRFWSEFCFSEGTYQHCLLMINFLLVRTFPAISQKLNVFVFRVPLTKCFHT